MRTPASFCSCGYHLLLLFLLPCSQQPTLLPGTDFPGRHHIRTSQMKTGIWSVLVGNKSPGHGQHMRAQGAHFLFFLASRLLSNLSGEDTHMHIVGEKISNCSIEPSILNETNWKPQPLTTRVGKTETACLKHPGYELWTPESWWDYLVRDGLPSDFVVHSFFISSKVRQYYIY